jgi:hypothetical protein
MKTSTLAVESVASAVTARSEHPGGPVVIVVDFGGFLAGVGAQDPSGVLDEPSFPPDRGGEEQGVQDRAVEALAGVRPGRDDEQRRAAWLRPQPGERGGAGPGAHAAAQHDRLVSPCLPGLGKLA